MAYVALQKNLCKDTSFQSHTQPSVHYKSHAVRRPLPSVTCLHINSFYRSKSK